MAEEAKKQEATQQAQQPQQPAAEKKNKKINDMTLAELDAKIKEVKEKMGGMQSGYAKQLLKQKDILTKQEG